MTKREFPGEFEQVVLLTIARLKDDAYGMAIRQEIADRTGRDVGIGSVYSALDRMEDKGFISSTVGDPTPERGGKAKRYYKLERAGALALERSREMFARLWDGLVVDDGNNGEPEAGETFNLIVYIGNLGTEATGVVGTLSIEDPDTFITIQNDFSIFGDVSRDTTTSNASNPFVVTLDSLTPGSYPLDFILDLTAEDLK